MVPSHSFIPPVIGETLSKTYKSKIECFEPSYFPGTRSLSLELCGGFGIIVPYELLNVSESVTSITILTSFNLITFKILKPLSNSTSSVGNGSKPNA